jgi:plastocyanin
MHPPRQLAVALSAAALVFGFSGGALAQDAPTVVENEFTFAPTELHVGAGTTVEWDNTSGNVHTITADDGSFDSGDQKPGASFQWTFDDPGRYQYYCQQHGGPGLTDMSGVIVVDG